MKANTMLETITSLLGTPACAIPLSCCKPAKSYLLERAGIPMTGTAILFTIPYVMTEDVKNPRRNLSLYAIPRDYHHYIKELSERIMPFLQQLFHSARFALFSDHSPIQEVDAAARSGLGVVGQNDLLITPEYGSFVFIGDIVTDADYIMVTGKDVPKFQDEPTRCENCKACISACPGKCRDGIRASCLSAITQKKGNLTEEEISAIRQGGLAWGCDICQLVCPHNIRVLREGKDTPIPYFREARLPSIDLAMLDAMSEEEFSARAYAWRGKNVIRRNLALWQEEPREKHERSEES